MSTTAEPNLLSSLAAQAFTDGQAPASWPSLHQRGLHCPNVEAWRSTSLKLLEQQPRQLVATSTEVSLLAECTPAEHRLVLVNGVVCEQHSQLPDGLTVTTTATLPESFHTDEQTMPLVAMMQATPHVAVTIRTAEQSDVALHVIHLHQADDQPSLSQTQVHVDVAAHSKLRIHEQHVLLNPEANHDLLTNHLHTSSLAHGSQLAWLRETALPQGVQLFQHSHHRVGEFAQLHLQLLETAEQTSRHALNVHLVAAESRCHIAGAMLAHDRANQDTRLATVHHVGPSVSNTLWRSMAGGRARTTLHGAIQIKEGADKSDATLASRGVVLNEGALVNLQPVLEIDTDDVVAAHGAAVGALDEAALFYLQSRGIPKTDAQAMLTEALFAEVLTNPWDDLINQPQPVLDGVKTRLLARIHHMAEQGG